MSNINLILSVNSEPKVEFLLESVRVPYENLILIKNLKIQLDAVSYRRTSLNWPESSMYKKYGY